jgi:hypothetical protein
VSSLLDAKENDKHALGFALHLSCPFFFLKEFELFHFNIRVWLMLSSLNTCSVIFRVSIGLFTKFAKKNYVHSLSDPLHKARYMTPNKRM